VVIRNRLYARLGASRARIVLATNYPGGSARSEINRRVALANEKGDTQNAAKSKVIEDIVGELVNSAILAQQQAVEASRRKS